MNALYVYISLWKNKLWYWNCSPENDQVKGWDLNCVAQLFSVKLPEQN